MTTAVLDASALLALLRSEPGHEKVLSVLSQSAMTAVNVAEVVAHFARQGIKGPDVRKVIDPLPFERIDFDEDLAYAAGLLLPSTKALGLSLGDRACLALAQRLGVIALTADHAWANVTLKPAIRIELIR